MQTVRGRLLEGRGEELSGLARALHHARLAEGRKADGVADYYAAETLLIQETFQRQLGCQVSLLSALRVRTLAFPCALMQTRCRPLPES